MPESEPSSVPSPIALLLRNSEVEVCHISNSDTVTLINDFDTCPLQKDRTNVSQQSETKYSSWKKSSDS